MTGQVHFADETIVVIALNHAHLDNNAWTDVISCSLKPYHAQYRLEGHNARLCNLIYLTQRLKASQLDNDGQF